MTEPGENGDRAKRVTNRGQVTIPRPIREQAGLVPGTEVAFVLMAAPTDAGFIEVRRRKSIAAETGATPGERWIEHRRGRGQLAMSTDEVIALMRGPPADDDVEPPP